MKFTVFAILLGACVATDPSSGGNGGAGGRPGMGSGSGIVGSTMGSDTGTGSGSMLPAELVGTWQSVDTHAALSYELTAQGGIVFAGDLDYSDGCTYEVQTSYTGSVTLQGNVLTLTPVDGTQISNICGEVTTTAFSQVEVDAYQIENTQSGPVLHLQDQSTGNVFTLTHP